MVTITNVAVSPAYPQCLYNRTTCPWDVSYLLILEGTKIPKSQTYATEADARAAAKNLLPH